LFGRSGPVLVLEEMGTVFGGSGQRVAPEIHRWIRPASLRQRTVSVGTARAVHTKEQDDKMGREVGQGSKSASIVGWGKGVTTSSLLLLSVGTTGPNGGLLLALVINNLTAKPRVSTVKNQF